MGRRSNGEGSIYQRKDGRWVAAVVLPEGRRRAYYGRTRQEAHTKLLKAQRSLLEGLPLPLERVTTGQWLEAWLKQRAAPKVRPRTFGQYQEIVRLHIIPALGRIRLVQLRPQEVERMMAHGIAAGQSPRSVNHWRAVLRTALNAGMREGVVSRNVASLADPQPMPAYSVEPLTVPLARRLLVAFQGDRLEALFTVGLALGLRRSEALGLVWEHVDLEGGTLSVQRTLQRVNGGFRFMEPKNERSRRTIRLPGPIVRVLREHRARQCQERLLAGAAWRGGQWGNLVFSDEVGEPLHGSLVTRRFQRLLALSGLPPMRYHDLRHGAASLMAALGVPVRVAMDILGHAQISTTMNIYAHIPDEVQGEAVDRVAAALWPEG